MEVWKGRVEGKGGRVEGVEGVEGCVCVVANQMLCQIVSNVLIILNQKCLNEINSDPKNKKMLNHKKPKCCLTLNPKCHWFDT